MPVRSSNGLSNCACTLREGKAARAIDSDSHGVTRSALDGHGENFNLSTKVTAESITRVSTPESREKARERQAKYRRKPDTRQKESSYLAQRRVAVKARRRLTDSSAKSKLKIHAPQRRSKKTTSPATGLNLPSTGSALELLADLATQQRKIGTPQPSSSYWESLTSDSRESSRDAALDLSVVPPSEYQNFFIDEKLPRYCSPATPAQRKNWRLFGEVGPLSGVQRAQLMVLDLARPQEFDGDLPRVHWDRSGRLDARVETMSSERWNWVRAWRQEQDEYDYNEDCEEAGRREAAEQEGRREEAEEDDR
ncbi:hypothetical protein R3P38DRAFT_2791946 [Favolaschia claudopus]|uniref:Uncharacterized protein n=1 Tax=Favolaschia claudopus TaxID=2862362 RepID=A0AAW0AFB1_9AGAR